MIMIKIKDYVTSKNIKNKNLSDKIMQRIFFSSAVLSASFIVLIVFFVSLKGLAPFFQTYQGYNFQQGFVDLDPVNPFRFIFGNYWLGGTLGLSNDYGIGFAIINTLIIVVLSIIITVPVAVATALFVAKIAPKPLATSMRSVIELLASIPSIIYGVFGLGVIATLVVDLANATNNQTAAGLSLLTTVLVLSMMILPTITAVAETAIRSVDKDLIKGSLALGATKMQTYIRVVLTAAKSGIFAGIILGVGRALGEATAVAMVSGNLFTGVTLDLFEPTTTLTSRMLLGIKETTGLDYDIRFSIGLVLIVVILITNFGLKYILRKVGGVNVKI
jgi:phosphate transport system permease protein